MFEDYKATKKDLEAIREGISFAYKEELDFIFVDKSAFAKLTIISFDVEFLYIWTQNRLVNIERIDFETQGYSAYKVKHHYQITDKEQRGWATSFRSPKMISFLPKELKENWTINPFMSGGLLHPFINLQKLKREKTRKHNPYITRESYLATIVHEFGHVYCNFHKPYYHGNKKQNLKWLTNAKALYEGEAVQIDKNILKLVSNKSTSELFAFCTDYSAAKIFWPNHVKDIERANAQQLKSLIKKENERDCYYESSVLGENAHNYAAVLGRLLIETFSRTWPHFILNA